jgi:hypothetical protein
MQFSFSNFLLTELLGICFCWRPEQVCTSVDVLSVSVIVLSQSTVMADGDGLTWFQQDADSYGLGTNSSQPGKKLPT